MTKHYEVQTILKSRTGFDRDSVVNTWSFVGPDAPTEAEFEQLGGNLVNFFIENHVPASGVSHLLSAYISNEIVRPEHVHECKVYRRPAAPPGPGTGLGSPVFTAVFGLENSADTGALPSQVSVGASFSASLIGFSEILGNTRPKAQRRGRLFIGPLDGIARTSGAHNEADVTANLQETLNSSMKKLAERPGPWGWEVFSRKNWTGDLVAGGYVDNRFDTQRRRLEKATERLSWVIA